MLQDQAVREAIDRAVSVTAEHLWKKHGVPEPIGAGELGPDDRGFAQYVPTSAVDDVTEAVVMFAAELLQCWLDAGSEREVTYEDLMPYVESHVLGWVAVPGKSAEETGPSYIDGMERAAYEVIEVANREHRRVLGMPPAGGTP